MAVKGVSPVLAVTGSEDFLRRRDLFATIQAQQKSGWSVSYVDGSKPGALELALSNSSFFLEDPRNLLVVSNPEKLKVELLQDHLASTEYDSVILLHMEGDPKANTKVGKFISSLGKWHHHFPEPDKDYKKKDVASSFCVSEAKRRGKTLSSSFADQMVDRLGTDLGFLSFEMLKVCTLADAEGKTDISLDMIKGAMAPLNQTESIIISDALLTKSPLALGAAFRRVRKSPKEDPTIQVSQMLGSIALGWLEVASLRDQGKSPDEIVGLLGKNDWYVKNKLLPSLQRWSSLDLIELIQALSWAQQTQRNGSISPWSCLCSRLFSLCLVSR